MLNAIMRFLIGVVVAIFSGFTLSTLWSWFVLGSLTTVAISIPQAIGLTYLVRLLTMQYIKQDDVEAYEHTLFIAMGSLFTLVFGWIVHLFM